MGLINTDDLIGSLVRETLGGTKEEPIDPSKPTNFKELFAKKGLNSEEAIEILAGVARNAPSELVQMRAIEMMFRLSGELKGDQNAPAIAVNITIVDSTNDGHNLDLLLPRELLKKNATDNPDAAPLAIVTGDARTEELSSIERSSFEEPVCVALPNAAAGSSL